MKPESSLGFLDHLEILRKKLISVAIVFFLFFILAIIWLDPLLKLLMKPLEGLPVKLIFIKPQEKFLSYIKVAFFAAFTGVLPYALFQLGHFIYPALHPKEKRGFVWLSLAVVILFSAGALFAYFILVPFMLNFFANFAAGEIAEAFWSLAEYLGLLLMTIFVLALVFETPLLLLFLMKVRILPYRVLKAKRRFIVVLIFLIAAVITPPDLYSQLLVGGLLYGLFELTLLFGRRWT